MFSSIKDHLCCKVKKVFMKPKVNLKKQKADRPLFYFGESVLGVNHETWNDVKSREFAWESAIETVKLHEKQDLPHLFGICEYSRKCISPSEMDRIEISVYGNIVTAGYYLKRMRFWKLLSYLKENFVPIGLSSNLISSPNFASPFDRSNSLYVATKLVIAEALKLIDEKANVQGLYEVDYTCGKEENTKLIGPMANYSEEERNSQQKKYKTLLSWTTIN